MRLPRDFPYFSNFRARRAEAARASPAAEEFCGSCRHFRNDPSYLEAAIPGLSSLGSAAASARADDGLCLIRDRYLGARASCALFAAALAAEPAAASTRRAGEGRRRADEKSRLDEAARIFPQPVGSAQRE